MRKKALGRVDLLEKEERSRQLEQKSSLATTFFFCRRIVLAYYLGDLEPEEGDPSGAEARALNYQSRAEYLQALLNGEKQEINKRFKKAARRLFARVL